MSTMKINGIELYYEVHGPERAPTVVLSNGVLDDTSSWASQLALLRQNYRVVLYDHRGQGLSAHPPGPYTFEQHADDLAGLLERLHCARAHVVGAGYGAAISMVFALRFPGRTQSLFVAGGVSQVDGNLATIIAGWRDAATRRDPELFFNVTTPFNFSPAWIRANPESLLDIQDRYHRLDFPAVARVCTCFLDLNISERLSEINANTCIVVGERDILSPRDYAQVLVDSIPRAELHVVREAGHAVFRERTAEFATILLGFLNKQPRG